MSEEPSKTGDFVPVTDKAEAEGLIREGLRILAPAILWTDNQAHRFRSQLHNRPGPNGTFSAMIPEDLNAAKLTEELQKLGTRHVYFSISLSRANIFFKTNYIGFSNDLLQFEFPPKIYKIQRRKDMRLQIRDGYVLRVDFQDPRDADAVMSKRAYDVSASGISVFIESSEAHLFPDGQELKSITFTVAGRTITTMGYVRHCKPVRGKNIHKIGIEFGRISAADAQHIAKYVFDENARFVSRFL